MALWGVKYPRCLIFRPAPSRSLKPMENKMFKIAPSILSADFGILAQEIKAVEDAGADMIHVDVMDGHFVPNITIGPPVVESIRKYTKLPLDVHLMIDNPDDFIDSFVKAGADIVSVHPEVCVHLNKTLETIKKLGAKPSIAINPASPLNCLDHVWDYIEMVLVMSVNPGFSGQKFIDESLSKISKLKKKCERNKPDIDIEVDGGINLETMGNVKKAGANVFVAGHAIFKSKDYSRTIKSMKQVLSA